mmetsp:Transcript_13078/g.36113  ORF Transcript_13078/g.36113 Transcript_13078/m.36113 type:complete len:218 (-) Transcript_13078:130-783(-)
MVGNRGVAFLHFQASPLSSSLSLCALNFWRVSLCGFALRCLFLLLVRVSCFYCDSSSAVVCVVLVAISCNRWRDILHFHGGQLTFHRLQFRRQLWIIFQLRRKVDVICQLFAVLKAGIFEIVHVLHESHPRGGLLQLLVLAVLLLLSAYLLLGHALLLVSRHARVALLRFVLHVRVRRILLDNVASLVLPDVDLLDEDDVRHDEAVVYDLLDVHDAD